MMTAVFQQPVPFPAEVKRRDIGERHRQKRGIQVGRLLVIPLDCFWRQLFFRVLAEKFLQ